VAACDSLAGASARAWTVSLAKLVGGALEGMVAFLVASKACHTRPELIKLSLCNLHPVHDGFAIFFTVAAEELDAMEVFYWPIGNGVIILLASRKVSISL